MAMTEIRIFYVGRGNSVLIRLGDALAGRYGIVDCYEGDDGSHPLLTFLEGVTVESIEFLVLTHPHKDHLCGVGRILDKYGPRIKRFYDCGIDPTQVMVALYNAVDKAEDLMRRDLDAIKRFCSTRGHLDRVSNLTAPGAVLYQDKEARILVDAIAPVGHAYKRAQESLSRYFRRCRLELERCNKESRSFRLPSPRNVLDLNHLSSAVRLRIDEKTFLLGGDVLRRNWTTLLKEGQLPADAVLLSHHGSYSGFPSTEWGTTFAEPHTLALISGEGYHQPSQSVVEHLTSRSHKIVSTGSAFATSMGSILREYVSDFHHRTPRSKGARQHVVVRINRGTISTETVSV